MSDNSQQQEVPVEGSVQFMQQILKEKVVASIIMGEGLTPNYLRFLMAKGVNSGCF
ncbi:TPA: hypothetical protein NJ132_000376 [Vibrio parahaemolyticus]|nr:hypothetical protein [Vibrio parahaemolyticus]HCE1695175.1 hypothetical protein [Vibrio parahaemolyticus]HCE1699846.1 hypothetical protein [Vibrio parahaemolyticus]HCE3048978.1 hypothetical protein [Vibrio parahaemolyticus]HCE3053138.1 hypothetical protein [Vibrio parahaemolyticus]